MRRLVAPGTIIGIVASMLSMAAEGGNAASPTLPSRTQIFTKLKLANDHFRAAWPDPCKDSLPGKRPSNIWTRAVYYEGALAYAKQTGDAAALTHAVRWGTFHQWNFRNGTATTNADDQCAAQCYIELFQIENKPERLANARTCINNVLKSAAVNHWTWIDAIHMAMPVYAKLGAIESNDAYLLRMNGLFNYPRTSLGLYNEDDHLWWRDTTFKKAKSPNGKNIYWSRGNGWVFSALARVLDVLPESDPHRKEYVTIFKDMAAAITAVQRNDGFWNENLADPTHFGGPEVTGTGLFTFGMAWGVNNGLLNRTEFMPVIVRAWNAIADSALFADGTIGYVQGTGDSPGDNGSGVNNVTPSRNIVPDFDDFGLGCVLLAGSETALLADDATPVVPSIQTTKFSNDVDIATPYGSRNQMLSKAASTDGGLFDLAGRYFGGLMSTNNATVAGHGIPAARGIFVMHNNNHYRLRSSNLEER